MKPQKIRLGDLLVENGKITSEQLESALATQKKTGKRLGSTLIELKYISVETLTFLLAQQLKISVINLKTYDYDKSVIPKLKEATARRCVALALKESGGKYTVALADPLDLYARDEIAQSLGTDNIEYAIAPEADILKTIDIVYRRHEEIASYADELGYEVGSTPVANLTTEADALTDDAPVAKLLQSIFEDAVQINASDIHIEPDEKVLRLRLRVDGVLQEQVLEATTIARALTSKIKLMANLDISETRVPQDGRMHIKIQEHSIDIRLSTMPTQHGESVVMRLLDQSKTFSSLDEIKMRPKMLKQYREAANSPHGLLLVTGPTGSGKTTTLYSTLAELNHPDVKIITAEDPVEYRLPRLTQVQVEPKIDLTFSRILRSTLRQDPDIILVGEIRDQETAEISMRAALTGHMVLSTLHTNDAPSSATRLVDMGLDGFLVATTLRGILAQRLIRKLCDSCAEAYTPNENELIWLKSVLSEDEVKEIKLKHQVGCTYCNGTGYLGRQPIFEFLKPNEAMLDALRRNDTAGFINEANKIVFPLVYDALLLAGEGVTSLDEVIRMTGAMDE